MNLDRLCVLFVLSLLPVLWLPFDWLPYGFGITGLSLLIALMQKSTLWLLLAVLQAVSYGQIFTIAKRADNVTVSRVQEPIVIEKVLNQGDFQSVIAKRATGERIYLTVQHKIPLQLSRQYQADFTIRPISSRLNIGNFDRQKWYFAQSIQQIGTLRHIQPLPHQTSSIRTKWLERVHEQTETLRSQGLLLALAFGERAWLEQVDWQHFQQTSTAHLIAISGLHIALAMGIGMAFGKGIQWFLWQVNGRQAVRSSPFFAKAIGFVLALGYSYLAGFAIPTLRALLAIGLILLCQALRRHYTAWQFWWRVVALLLLLDPVSLLSDSFWLSVLAVGSLIFWYQFFPLKAFLEKICKKISGSYRLLLGLVHLQVGIWLVFSPVQFTFFDGISPFALLANLLIVPLYSLVLVPLILFTLLTDNGLHTWQLADCLSQVSLWILEPLSGYWIDLSYSQQWQIFSFNVLILLLLYGWLHQPVKWWWICLLPIALNRFYFVPNWILPQPMVQWLHFDVGQGLAMALVYQQQGEQKAVIYDTGSSWQGGSMAELEILPYLKRQGIDVSAVFISHSDNDHAGGVTPLLKAYPKAVLITSDQQNYGHFPSEHCVAGQFWQFGDIRLQAIFPEHIVNKAENQESCVLVAEVGKFRLLLTGDSGIKQEQQFSSQIGKIDFLQVGHHGSNTSTSHTLLANTQPDMAIISAGRWNPWRLPNQQVEKRLEQYQIPFFNTAQVGMVKMNFYTEHHQIVTARSTYSPWYQHYFGKK